MMVKKNTFTDFIAAGESLIKEKYTGQRPAGDPGGSAALAHGRGSEHAPRPVQGRHRSGTFVDVNQHHADASLPLTTSEYLEWGNPNIKKEYDYINDLLPLRQRRREGLSGHAVKVSLNDSQVPYWEGTKFVAKIGR